MSNNIIQLKNVKKAFYVGQDILRDVTFSVPEGKSVVLLGRSGSGKSVTLRHILGLIQPDAGSVIVDGLEVTKASQSELTHLRENVGMLFQNAALWDSMNVFDNIALALQHRRILSDKAIKDRVYECLEEVGLSGADTGALGDQDMALRMPSDLSGGMRKRVGLARAIATRPKIMLYDEPTTGLDPIMAGIIDRLIRKLNEEHKITSLTITHDMASAQTVADQVAMLSLGKIIYDDTKENWVKLKEAEYDPAAQPAEGADKNAFFDLQVMKQFVKASPKGLVKPGIADHREKRLAHQ